MKPIEPGPDDVQSEIFSDESIPVEEQKGQTEEESASPSMMSLEEIIEM